jgi:heat shock protein HtpX
MQRAQRLNAFDESATNKWKSYILMFMFALIIIALGYVFGMIFGKGNSGIIILFMVMAFAVSIFIGLASYYWGDKAALSISNAKPANKAEYPHYVNSVEGLAIAAGLPKPEIYILPDEAINAFATGRNPEHASIAVTKGAIQKLSRTELEGVIAHEMSHIKNYDMRLMTITVILVGLIALVSDIFIRSMFFSGGDDDRGGSNPVFLVIGIVLAILAPIIAQLIQLTISRKREYAADATGALLSRHPEGLANALKKIQKEGLASKTASKATAHLYFSNPLKKGFFNNLFSTHPPIEERIKRLESM